MSKQHLQKCLMILVTLLTLSTSQLAVAADKDPKVAWDMIDAGALIVDVRTAEEFAAGHLPNAINIPFEIIVSAFKERKIAKDKSVVLYCRSGRRSGIAFDALVAQGYSNSYNGGGYVPLMNSLKK
ncbi:rhodanese-like domain-containing protein [Shewanella atlantica]|uniref:rhodanese-like domain-containing protein n=2 Tax=Shewanella TaxID=22 RepID=UPI003735C3E7